MKLIIGLGNPGEKYADDRHNVGFMVLDSLVQQWSTMPNWTAKHQGLIHKHKDIILLKPQTFMNNSGQSVQAVVSFYKLDLSDLLLIYDDIDLDFGQIRYRAQGSSGGHNGIKSIAKHLGTTAIPRIKIGVGRPPAGINAADYVLSPFSKDERLSLQQEIIPSVREKIKKLLLFI
jgi:PTH1 family peptidyl-tRNA hydrolase